MASRNHVAVAAVLGATLLVACPQPVEQPPAPVSCQVDLDCKPTQRCGEAKLCEARPSCTGDGDCQADEECRSVDGTCRLRPGFGRECARDNQCYPGFFCALGDRKSVV